MIRLAIVGGGPKSLFALLALNDVLSRNSEAGGEGGSTPPISVDVFDPCPPGAGSVWREDQPLTLRMNVSAAIVDASSTLRSETLTQWLRRAHPQLEHPDYPPRAIVGEYLREHYELLASKGVLKIGHVPAVVEEIKPAGNSWRLHGSFGALDYDEVLLTTGHGLASATDTDPLPSAINTHPFMGDYSALDPLGDLSNKSVWIRGAALTAFDLALLLTEGSGGSWDWSESSKDDAGLPDYQPSGAEPRHIVLASRSGQLMESKIPAVPQAITQALLPHKSALLSWGQSMPRGEAPSAHQPAADAQFNTLWRILLQAASDCGAAMGTSISPLQLWRTALSGRVDRNDQPPVSRERKVASAVVGLPAGKADDGGAAPSSAWLLARAWSGLYPELVAAMDRHVRSERQSRTFARVAANLERFAFGPPPMTARKLQALAETGLISVDNSGADSSSQEPPADAVVLDAVTPRPGIVEGFEVYKGLLAGGYVRIRAGERGLLTREDGSCVAADGSVTEGLAAIGRATEGPTLGHDTLNRELHSEYKLWARRIANLVNEHADKGSAQQAQSEFEEDM